MAMRKLPSTLQKTKNDFSFLASHLWWLWKSFLLLRMGQISFSAFHQQLKIAAIEKLPSIKKFGTS